MQKEFAWELSSMESTISRIVTISKAERDLLIALVRIYGCQKSEGFVEGKDGCVAAEPSKQELADALGVSVPTIKRKLKLLRGDSRFLTVSGDHWRPHLYEIDFQAIYSAELKDVSPLPSVTTPQPVQRRKIIEAAKRDPPKAKNDPGSGGSARGVMIQDQGDQKGGSGGSSGAPSIQSNNPFNPNNKQSIQSTPDGSLERFSFQGLCDRDFREAAAIQSRFEEVLAAEIAKDCEADRNAFFALVLHLDRTRKKIRNPPGLLTDLMRGGVDKYGQTWKTKPKDKDHEQARKMIQKLDYGPKEERPEAICYEFGDVDESEFTDEVPLPEELETEAEEHTALSLAEITQLQEVQKRKKQELAKT